MNFLQNPKFYYINLNTSEDRNNIMKTSFKKYNLNYLRIPAVDANIPGLLNQLLILPNKTNQSQYELGCTTSHLISIKKAYDDNLQEVLIMEDNVNIDFFIKNILKFKNIIKEFPRDYEIIQLLTNNPVAVKIFTHMIKKKIYIKWDPLFWGTKAYLINRKGMKKILDNYFKNGWFTLPKLQTGVSYENDIYHTADFLLYKTCITYTLIPQFFNFSPTKSTINSTYYDVIYHSAIKFIKLNQSYI